MKARFGAIAILSALSWSQGAAAATGVPSDWQVDLQDAASPMMESLRSFNTLLLAIIVPIVVFVLALLLWVMIRYRESANPTPSRLSHNSTIEVIWTIVPVLILVVIAIPSFRLLFRQFDFPKADVIVKATGHQWYWSYDYPDEKLSFDSYPVDDSELKPGQLRTLAVDNEMVVPVNKVVQVLTAGADVIHQWVVPAFGSRVDAMPGRVNRTWFQPTQLGTFYGQCSALCGQGHSYMPIAVKVVSEADYAQWLASKKASASAGYERLAAAGETGSKQ